MKIPLLNSFISKKKDIEENTSISSLAPKILTKKEDLDKVQPYLDKLKDTLNTKGINNIALTGGYGSGKSTIIKTFQHWNKDNYNFLNISLAAFNQNNTKESFKELYELKIKNGKTANEAEKEIANEFKETIISNEELERQLEISILQQIVYKVKSSNLPESRFKRIVNIPNWKLWGLIPICFILWVISVILLFKYDFLDKLNPNTWTFKLKDFDLSSNIIFLFSFLGVGYFSKLVVELFSNSKINKVNLKGEIEIGDNSNKSILNEHYDEILYYFEKNPFNVLVIEDLDRFDNTNIFTKLRELNILLNNAETLNNKKEYRKFGIKFLYAVGDDLFNDKKERVKFFEYIIPVIPFINSSNAEEQLKTLIKESELEEDVFTRGFISDITTFIDDIDMRLLVNIFHEFVIYRNILKPDILKGNEAELFAIITYKNIEPEDFNELNSKKGKLYGLINNKNLYVKKLIGKINDEITSKNTEIKNIRSENNTDIEELRRIYIHQILTKFPTSTPIYINEIKINNLLKDEEFGNLIENESISYRWSHQSYSNPRDNTLNFKFSEIENEVNPNFTYYERVELIESKHNNRIEILQKEIEKLKKQITEIENWDLKQIFREIDINQYLNNFSNNGLLRNLVLEGYINENYNDYISLFHEVSLKREDKRFEKSVKSGFNEEFSYKLTHIENLIEKLELKWFGREAILNFDLLNFLGNNYERYSAKYDAIIKLLSNEKQRSIEFIDRYIEDESRPIEIFIEKLVLSWSGLWEYIYLKSNYTKEKQDYYLSMIVKYAKTEDVLFSQNSNILVTAIMQKPHFLSIVKNTEEHNYFDKISTFIKQLNVKFEKLDSPTEETEKLFDYVYNNNHYRINKNNLLQMLLIFGNENIEDEFNNSNYSTILKSECKPLIDYINSNITTYVEDVYLKLEDNKFEEESSLIKLLNNENLNSKSKVKIIQKVETKINEIWSIDELDISEQLLINNKLVPTWENVVNYFEHMEEINEELVTFLNFENVYLELSEQSLEEENKVFEESMLICNEISDKAYEKLIKSCFFVHNELDFKNLNEKKVINLIDGRILTTTKSNYDLLIEYFPNNHITLIEKDFNKFFEKVGDFETDVDDILMILQSENITIDNRFKYITKLSEQTIIDNKAIAKKVGEIIISKFSKIEFEFNTIESIVKSLDSNENKVKLVNLYFTELSNENIISLVKIIGYYYSELFVKQHKPIFNDNAFNRELLTKLKSKGLISSFDIYAKDNTKIRAVANY